MNTNWLHWFFFIFKFHRTMLNQMPNSSFGGNHTMEKSLVTPTFVTRWLPTKSRKWYIHLKCMFNKRWNIVICRRSKAFYQSIKQILLYDAAKLVVFSFMVLRTNLRPPKRGESSNTELPPLLFLTLIEAPLEQGRGVKLLQIFRKSLFFTDSLTYSWAHYLLNHVVVI